VGFLSVSERIPQEAEQNENRTAENPNHSTDHRSSEATKAIENNSYTHECGENGSNRIDSFSREWPASENREHQGKENEEHPKWSPVSVTRTDTDFAKKPAETAYVKKAEGKGIHEFENESGSQSFKPIV
jgi:hypothetical protein